MASFLLRRWKDGIHRFQFQSQWCFGRGRLIRAMSGSTKMLINSADESAPSRISPWLTLPPAIKGCDMVYRFYNLSENRIETGVKLPAEDDVVLVGSSHGWLAFFNQRNNRVFLSNPLTGRRFNLPSIHTLPNPEINLRDGHGIVSKVILSCSPDDDNDNCRAMMSFGPGDRLAFCTLPDPGECWTPIGDLIFKEFDIAYAPSFAYGRAYDDFVYCTRRRVFSCIIQFSFDLVRQIPNFPTEMEDWDLHDPDSPRSEVCDWLTWLKFEAETEEEKEACYWLTDNDYILERCKQIPYLLFADQLYIITRFVCDSEFPCKTIGFSVVKVVYSKKRLVEKLLLVGSLDGLSVFVGINHSFAVPAAELGLKPNCIYFTDVVNTRPSASSTYDIRIFDYKNKTVSNHVYDFPRDPSLTGVATPPMWFSPSRY